MPRFNRFRAAVHRHPALLTIVVIVLVAGLGYLRLGGIVSDVKSGSEKTDVVAHQAQDAAGQAKRAAAQAQAAIDLSNAQKLDARIAACLVDRNFAMGHNALVKGVERSVGQMVETVFHLTTANAPPDVKAQVEDLIHRLNSDLVRSLDPNTVPVRECDPVSVAAFYNDQPVQGASP